MIFPTQAMRGKCAQTIMSKKALLTLATLITTVCAAFAEKVSYAEGSYTIPDHMAEVPPKA
jgi:hypothetical protein